MHVNQQLTESLKRSHSPNSQETSSNEKGLQVTGKCIQTGSSSSSDVCDHCSLSQFYLCVNIHMKQTLRQLVVFWNDTMLRISSSFSKPHLWDAADQLGCETMSWEMRPVVFSWTELETKAASNRWSELRTNAACWQSAGCRRLTDGRLQLLKPPASKVACAYVRERSADPGSSHRGLLLHVCTTCCFCVGVCGRVRICSHAAAVMWKPVNSTLEAISCQSSRQAGEGD